MKKIIALLMAGILLMAAAAFAEEVPVQVADPDAWNDEVIDGGWGVASDPAVTDEMRDPSEQTTSDAKCSKRAARLCLRGEQLRRCAPCQAVGSRQ